MKSSRLKPRPIDTEAEFFSTVNSAAARQAELHKIEAARDAQVVKIQQGYAETIELFESEITRLVERAAVYADEHRAELLPKDRKSVELATAIFGWRTGTKRDLQTESGESHLHIGLPGSALFRKTERHAATFDCGRLRIGDDPIFCDLLLRAHVLLEPERFQRPNHQLIGELLRQQPHAQSEGFFIEPKAPTGETLKSDAA
jgi:hypothetical protein